MKVVTQWRPGTDLIDVWIRQETFNGAVLLRMKPDGLWEWEKVEPAESISPTFTLPGDVFNALITEGADILPPSAATERHLADAIKVRDQLLALLIPG
jgi:hypothetical protein